MLKSGIPDMIQETSFIGYRAFKALQVENHRNNILI